MSTSVTTATYYVAKTKATRTRDDQVLKHNIGDEFTLVAGEWIGMDGYRMPGWTEYLPAKFPLLINAMDYVKNLPGEMYGFKVIPDTVSFSKVTVTTTTEEEEVTLDA
ncbi:hypothetical protein EVB97_038 [Rhizobium phage RHph_Y65]|uniref:Uncharacterized protein n=1 Tax=Rhizobium phage RHph_Y65 TaxID=2509785 RepID=A0A7S5R7L5_9CAUD|nr:hypothetical protein PQC17_gp038 [Rhizobium phage RHph_Y65]QIG72596.1 hypothetical protein EVB97_038 [Rhizobium phage RHph_Y65]